MQIRNILNQLLMFFFKGEDNYNCKLVNVCGVDHKVLDFSYLLSTFNFHLRFTAPCVINLIL